MDSILTLDVVRGLHLLFVAIGMGSAMYFDMRSLNKIALPLSLGDIEELHRIHRVVSLSCIGLWFSGAALIWYRTGFDLAEFSPKLWAKVIVVSTLTANAFVLAGFAIPTLSTYKGVRLIDLPTRLLLPMSICAGVSLSCWILALLLGSSVTLKTASWDVLIPVMLGGSALCIAGIVAGMFGLRALLHGKFAGFVSSETSDSAQ